MFFDVLDRVRPVVKHCDDHLVVGACVAVNHGDPLGSGDVCLALRPTSGLA
jgi:hypothetical protein